MLSNFSSGNGMNCGHLLPIFISNFPILNCKKNNLTCQKEKEIKQSEYNKIHTNTINSFNCFN